MDSVLRNRFANREVFQYLPTKKQSDWSLPIWFFIWANWLSALIRLQRVKVTVAHHI